MEVSLLLLYPIIIVPVLTDWIDFIDLGYCDTAICSKRLRNSFLDTLLKCNVDPTKLNDPPYEWIALRGSHLRNVHINAVDRNKPSQTLLTLLTTSKLIQRLSTVPCMDLAILVKVLKLSVKELVLKDRTNNGTIISILTVFKASLTSLDLSQCRGLSRRIYQEIPVLCPHLIHFRGPEDTNIVSLLQNSEDGFNDFDTHCGSLVLIRQTSPISLFGVHYDLQELVIQCRSWSSEDCEILLPTARNLKFLSLNGKHKERLTPLLESFLNSCTNLRHFVANCIDFDECALHLIRLIKACPKLENVCFLNCDGVNDTVICELMQCCPLLKCFGANKFSADEETLRNLVEKCHVLRFGDVRKGKSSVSSDLVVKSAVGYEVLVVRHSHSTEVSRGSDRQYSILKCIVSMDLKACDLVTMFQQCPRLVKIEIDRYQELTDGVMERLVLKCPLLEVIFVTSVYLTEASLVHIARCKHLTSLNFVSRACINITADILSALVHDKPNMVKFALPQKNFPCAALPLIATHCPCIRYLNVGGSKTLRSEDVIGLLASCPRVDSLDLEGCMGVKSNVLNSFVGRKMKYLNVKDSGISKQEIMKVVLDSDLKCDTLVY